MTQPVRLYLPASNENSPFGLAVCDVWDVEITDWEGSIDWIDTEYEVLKRLMSERKSVDLENYYLIEDSTTRESFQQLYDNSRNLQSQVDALVGAIQSADTLMN